MSPRQAWIFRLTLAAASVFCLGIAVQTALPLTSAWMQARASRTWPKVEGQMLTGRVDHPAHRPHGYTLQFRYAFNVSGKGYEGTQITAGDVIDTSRFAELAEKYGPGKSVAVAYDPHDPSRAVLEPGVTPGHRFLFIAPPVLVMMAALLGWGALRTGR